MEEINTAKTSNSCTWRNYINDLLVAEISTISRYCDQIIQWKPRINDCGALLENLDNSKKSTAQSSAEISGISDSPNHRAMILLNANINYDHDIAGTLAEIKTKLNRGSRVTLVAYNPYLRTIYSLANKLGIRKGELPTTFVTNTSLSNIAKLAGFEVVRIRPTAYCPFKLFGIGNIINQIFPIIPGIRWLSLTAIITLRPIIAEKKSPSLSIVIPARNERGNIENALKRIPPIANAKLEIIFVEGHSKDGTWEEIQRVLPLYADRFTLSAYQQTGKGKSDAVRLGFSKATCDLLTILDADLTMPPELLHRFYDPYVDGLADFVNGSRLTYPMEGEAMRPLNHLGNVFFAKALSTVLGVRISDSLCGTKLLTKHDYDRFIAWRNDFGDFDPFGDFELLFPAAILALGIIDVPIRYRDRTYGSTNISRFRHGLMLLKMTIIGFFRAQLGKVATASQEQL